ncbi:unnamed protein product [Cylicocyclus nassatus]|uniref:G-protein coupled receptors family 1 profile domain-containing protein n=1 Tax=Cylicocyclus nassatus TaxID=53992 RepID=A0AA36H4E1_CYLNA|nr:unnamed protein product [Cylicocyclus nassatus]
MAGIYEDIEFCDPNQIYGEELPICEDPFTVFDHYMNYCVPATLIQFVDQENEPNMKIIYGFLLPVLSIIVLLSNGVVIFVLNEQKTKRATVEPLMWMAISALLMAASPLPFTIYYYNLGHMRDLNQTEFLCYLQKVCMEILPFFFNTLITFFTLLLGMQRFIAVQYPLDSFRWCSRRLIRRYSKAILVLATVLTLIHFTFDIRVIYHFCIRGPTASFWVARCFIGHSPLTRAMGPDRVAWVFDCFRLGLIVIPSVLLFIITILLIRTMQTLDTRKLRANFAEVSRHKRVSSASRNTTVMLTVIIALFLLARAPSMILIILVKLSDLLPLGSLEFAHSAYLRSFSNIILITLHPISFAIYMFMSRRFRVSLRRLLGWRFLASDEEFHAVTSSRNSQLKAQGTRSSLGLPSYRKGSAHTRRGSGNSIATKKSVMFVQKPSMESILTNGTQITNGTEKKSLSNWSGKTTMEKWNFLKRFKVVKQCDTHV